MVPVSVPGKRFRRFCFRFRVKTVPVSHSGFSRSETWVPKRGGLKPAGKRQESATFLQRSFFDAEVQFFVCCSAAFGPK